MMKEERRRFKDDAQVDILVASHARRVVSWALFFQGPVGTYSSCLMLAPLLTRFQLSGRVGYFEMHQEHCRIRVGVDDG